MITLAAGNTFLVPGGAWNVRLGPYLTLQEWDPQLLVWMNIGADGGAPGSAGGGPQRFINSDGINFRIANQTGCVVGALITTAGSGYTNGINAGLTCASDGGSPTFTTIVGGAVNTSVTITDGGTNYDYAPILVVSAPPPGGIPCTMTCTISGGIINAVTVVNQGAGYTTAPTITVVRDPRDDSGQDAVLTAALTGSGTLTGLLVTNHGTAVTSIPALTFTGGGGSSAAATAVMCWTLTAYVVVTAGSGYAGAPIVTGVGGFPTSAAAYTNPATQRQLVRERPAWIRAALSTVTITATGQVVDDGGIYAGVPTALLLSDNVATLTTAAGLTFTVGGAASNFWLNPA
jgi:hypothetical protein